MRMHLVSVEHEGVMPFQWIGKCSCGKGIRCNSRYDAYRFLIEQGCYKREPPG